MTLFFESLWNVLLALSPWLLLGTGVAGMMQVLLPEDFLKRQLSGPWGVLKAVALGVPLPLCSCGVIPVGMGLKNGNASDGAIVGFLISTPQTGVDSILVSASFLGWPLAVFKLLSATITGLLGGWLTDFTSNTTEPLQTAPLTTITKQQPPRHANRIAVLFGHSMMLLRSLWGWLFIGIITSAAIEAFVPNHVLAGLAEYGSLAAMFGTLLIAIPLYVCATASVPIAAALVAAGLPAGAVLVFLMAGPATNVATLGAIYRTLGLRPLMVYLATVIFGSIACGWAFDSILDAGPTAMIDHHEMSTWWSTASAIILLVLIGWFCLQDALRLLKRWSLSSAKGPTITVRVGGMTCQGCVAELEKTLTSEARIHSATVTLEPGCAVVHGEVSESRVRQLIEQAGFHPT